MRRLAAALSVAALALCAQAEEGAGPEVPAVEVVRAPIGSGEGDLAVIDSDEGWAHGPMSFAVSPAGEILVLDQLNSRIQVFARGARRRSIPIDGTTYVDLALSPDGGIALLDNLVKQSITLWSAAGERKGAIPLAGLFLPEPFAARGVTWVADGLWVDTGRGWARVADRWGAPLDQRTRLDGQPSWDASRVVRAEVLGEATVEVGVKVPNRSDWRTFPVYFGELVSELLGVAVDRKRNLCVAAALGGRSRDRVEAAELRVLDHSGKPVRRIPLVVTGRAEEVRHALRVTPDGVAYHLVIERREVVVRRYGEPGAILPAVPVPEDPPSRSRDLAVKLALPGRRIEPGQELAATVNIHNQGSYPLSVLVPTGLVGRELLVTDPEGEEVRLLPGLRPLLLKPDLFMGKAVRLAPRERVRFEIFLYLDGERRLHCSALAQADPARADEATAADLPPGIPARYVQASQLFRLTAHGPHRISFRVAQGEGDRSWRLGGGGPAGWASDLWIGSAESNPVQLEVP